MKFPESGILPVIHRSSDQQSVEAAGVAKDSGAKGVFVIDHLATAMDPDVLLETYAQIKKEFPDFWVGLNNLGVHPADRAVILACEVPADGVWVDNAYDRDATFTGDLRSETGTVYFGGLAMKGSGYIEDPETAGYFIREHLDLVDVAVTSGPGTGQSCPAARLEAIRAHSPDAKLAIASGVDLENVARHSRLVDYILVASSVETYPYSGVFDPNILAGLVEADSEVREACVT
jgi:hypothetical protein